MEELTIATPRPQKEFRPEIEGLRAVAALLVAVFHIWLHRVSGGVDVFFVVSGFLITTGLMTQVARDQRVDFLAFWSRLAQRLIPSAMLVLLTVIVASFFFLPQSRWKDTIQHVAASASYTENWLLAFRSVDYLAQHQATSPLQHFWALSVQGQFYLIWPFVLAASWALARRMGAAWTRVLCAIVLLLFCASLAFSIGFTHKNQPFAYFHPFARLWEFCTGALLALVRPHLKLARGLRLALGWAGLIAILSCGFLFQVSRVFPGYAALWPVLAGAAVIAAGSGYGGLGTDRWLASKPMVYLGSISYAIYLWHFPLLIFVQVWETPRALHPVQQIGILLAAIGLAALSTRWVETPLRKLAARRRSGIASWRVPFACALPALAGLVVWSAAYLHVRRADPSRIVADSARYPGARAFIHRHAQPVATRVLPNPTMVEFDREYLPDDCNQGDDSAVPVPCVLTGEKNGFTVAIVGGSHSSQWNPALVEIARASGWRLISFAKSNCPFYLGEDVGSKLAPWCPAWNRSTLAQLIALKPQVVFTTSTRLIDGTELVPQGYMRAWQALRTTGTRIIALRDNPSFEFDVSACVELHGAEDPRCSLRRAELLAERSPTDSLRESIHHVKFIDLSDYFCYADQCPPVAGNVLIYRHMNHVTSTYVRTMTPMLSDAFKQALN